MNKDNTWTQKWRDLNEDSFEAALKKAKRAGKFKLVASFGIGTALGTAATAFIAFKLFKLFLGGWLRA